VTRARPRRIPTDKGAAMRAEFLRALAQRVARNPEGRVTLPTGAADAGEVAKVMTAIDRARKAGDGRC
jgi:hypothetical protein